MKFGTKFREIRNEQEKSLRDVERDTGITRGYLSRFERNKIPNASFSRMETLADYYGVDINTIITSDEQEWKENLPKKLKEFIDERVDSEDLLISALINISPKIIILHFRDKEIENLLNRIFPGRIKICKGCDLCWCKIKT